MPVRHSARHRSRLLLAIGLLAVAVVACTRQPASFPDGTRIPQPTPDRTVEAVVRGLASPVVVASPAPTEAPAAPVARATRQVAQAPTAAPRVRAAEPTQPALVVQPTRPAPTRTAAPRVQPTQPAPTAAPRVAATARPAVTAVVKPPAAPPVQPLPAATRPAPTAGRAR